jgi:threonylcarbamoyladenosine tRNA methylthiotransferase CDKAL1
VSGDSRKKPSRRVYVKSYGCPTNTADGEVMSGCLSTVGYDVVSKPQDADILIYNTCAVKTPTEDRMFFILRHVPKAKHLIVTGCLPLINFERLKSEIDFDGVLGPAPGCSIVEAVDRILRGDRVVALENDSKPDLTLPRVPVNNVVAIVPINYGCLGSCAYCCVRLARGRLRSYKPGEIEQRVRQALTSGVKEIWFTSQDTACYGRDVSTDLAHLLRRICEVEGDFLVRVGMMTPNLALEILDDLINAYEDDKIFKFLHLPVQSGDNEVLRLMNRLYSVESFKRIVQSFRKKIPEITIATDVICGFPGESDEAFTRTTKLIKRVQPDIVNVSKFFPRPYTPAMGMKQLDSRDVKGRSKAMAELSRRIAFERNERWMHWKGTILVDERGRDESWIGRNFAYKPVVVKSDRSLLGRYLKVQVRNTFPTYLEAEITQKI